MEPVWETASERSGVESLSSAGGTAATEETGGEEEVFKVFVALPELHKNGKSTLAWTLRHLAIVAPDAAAVVVVIAHVHAPAQMIPLSTYRSF